MLITQEVEIICKTRKKYYLNKGYDWKYLDSIKVKIEDLSKGSHEMIEVLCDYCLEEGKKTIVQKKYCNYLIQKSKSEVNKDCCDNCWSKKLAETMNIKYGQVNASLIDIFNEKKIQTFINKYGVDNPNKISTSVEKSKQTNIIKYGVPHMMQLDGEYDIRMEKARETTFSKGEGVKSSQQIYLNELLGGILNYPVGKYLLDIAFINDKIYLEYDGSGHDLQVKMGNMTEEERLKKEIKRYYFMKNRGWKFIRLVSTNDKLPNKKILKYLFDLANHHLKYGRNYFEINIDKHYIKYNDEIIPFQFGRLRKITKNTQL